MIAEILVFITVYSFILITGACIGSFLNVVSLRALSGESIVFPGSKCPKCGNPIKWYDNIPVISYLILKGKCRNCQEKISIQYPIVEAITGIMFLIIFLWYGISLKSILLTGFMCCAIVIMITDLKSSVIYNRHCVAAGIFAVAFAIHKYGFGNYASVLTGIIGGAIIMEAIARLSYYFIKKKSDKTEEEVSTEAVEPNCESAEEKRGEEKADSTEVSTKEDVDEKDMSIEEYVEKYKRAFGEGDTILAAISGAILGIAGFILSIFCAVILQALFILPQFIKSLADRKEYRLAGSLIGFVVFSVLYFIFSNMFQMTIYTVLPLILPILGFALYALIRLKTLVNTETHFHSIPFGPAILITTILVLFFEKYIGMFFIHNIFFLK